MIYIAGDKYGFKTIRTIKEYLESKKLEYQDLGVQNESEDLKLQDMIPRVVTEVLKGSQGILVCGTGVGVEVGANKFSGIRACLATNEKIAEWARVYDDCNALCIPGWETSEADIIKILEVWFRSEYDGNPDRKNMFQVFDSWH